MKTYFTDRGGQADGAELALRFPLPHVIVGGLTLEKRVTVHLRYHRSSGHPLEIGWRPLEAGPVPSFDGTLAAMAESETSCRLTISGSYAPPGGIAGVVFDQLIGVHIAGATVGALLERFTRAIESEYAVRSVP